MFSKAWGCLYGVPLFCYLAPVPISRSPGHSTYSRLVFVFHCCVLSWFLSGGGEPRLVLTSYGFLVLFPWCAHTKSAAFCATFGTARFGAISILQARHAIAVLRMSEEYLVGECGRCVDDGMVCVSSHKCAFFVSLMWLLLLQFVVTDIRFPKKKPMDDLDEQQESVTVYHSSVHLFRSVLSRFGFPLLGRRHVVV